MKGEGIMSGEKIEEKIKKWLKSSGFPLEMDAAHIFREEGFEVRQSVILRDIQEEKPREVDILASFPYEQDLGLTKITCVLECKSSQQPWLIFSANDTLSNYNKLYALAVMSPDAIAGFMDIILERRYLTSWQYFHNSAKCGYSLRQPFSEKDTAYSAAMNVLKACRNLVEPSSEHSLARIKFAFPIIVVDSPIFECSKVYDELVVTEVQHSKFLFSSYIPDFTGCCIHIVHISALENFAKYFRNVSNEMRELFQEYEQKFLSNFSKKNGSQGDSA
jgi:hypothetical protein